MKKLGIAIVTAALLSACAQESAEDHAETIEEKAEPAAEATAEFMTETDAEAQELALCLASGPQTPRDIASKVGLNKVSFDLAPQPTEMNLCNIHTHTNAEHKGPGFSVFVGDGEHGGYACNNAGDLTEAELTDPTDGHGAMHGVKPGDTIEVHWVHTTCEATPGEGLGACVPEGCEDPALRVEAQTFLVVNDENALDFNTFDYVGAANAAGLHQPLAIPTGTGEPVVFLGSTTGPSYTQSKCSPFEVTWSVRPQCAKVDISSLHAWAEKGNVFNETHSHGVRQLVTAPELLSPIE